MLTKWTNPTDQTLDFKIFEGPGLWVPLHFEPKETKLLPSRYDDAIHQVDSVGRIVGGCAPQLVRENQRERIHEDLLPPVKGPATSREAELEMQVAALAQKLEERESAAEPAGVPVEAFEAMKAALEEQQQKTAELEKAKAESDKAAKAAESEAKKAKAEAAKAKADAEAALALATEAKAADKPAPAEEKPKNGNK